MIEALSNQIDQEQISTSNASFIQFILAIQSDNVDRAGLVQSSEMTLFPPVPSLGGIFSTRKGCYEAIYTDADPEVAQWRRLSDGVTYLPGSTIPSTL